jgi:hypothetical protein
VSPIHLTRFPSSHIPFLHWVVAGLKNSPSPCCLPFFQYPLYLLPSALYNKIIENYVFLKLLPLKYTITILFIFSILSLILSEIRPSKYSLTIHFIVFPISNILTLISPSIYSLSIYIIIGELTFIYRSVSPLEFPESAFFPLFIFSIIRCSIRP